MITEKAYAKINLYLDVLNKREDGYHNILSVMTEVKSDSFYDTVTVRKAENRSMTCSDPTLTVGEDNLPQGRKGVFWRTWQRRRLLY